jgi:hypothetical protein
VSAPDVCLGDAMNSYVVGVEIILRVNEPNIRGDLSTVLKNHNANLTNAAHPRIRSFEVHRDEVHASP